MVNVSALLHIYINQYFRSMKYNAHILVRSLVFCVHMDACMHICTFLCLVSKYVCASAIYSYSGVSVEETLKPCIKQPVGGAYESCVLTLDS